MATSEDNLIGLVQAGRYREAVRAAEDLRSVNLRTEAGWTAGYRLALVRGRHQMALFMA